MKSCSARPAGVSAGGVPDVVAMPEPGLMSAVKRSLTNLPAARSADVTGTTRLAGSLSFCVSTNSASQKLDAPDRPDSAQWPLSPLTPGPEMYSGFVGIDAEPV